MSDSLKLRLDASKHLIVLATPEAAKSEGMAFEADYWFSKPRSGEVLIVITAGEYQNWNETRDNTLPPVAIVTDPFARARPAPVPEMKSRVRSNVLLNVRDTFRASVDLPQPLGPRTRSGRPVAKATFTGSTISSV